MGVDLPGRRPGHARIMANLPACVCGIALRSRAEVARFTTGLPEGAGPGAGPETGGWKLVDGDLVSAGPW